MEFQESQMSRHLPKEIIDKLKEGVELTLEDMEIIGDFWRSGEYERNKDK